MSLEPCWLTHHTGTIIRFRSSQVPRLPDEDVDLTVELFDGQVAPWPISSESGEPVRSRPRRTAVHSSARNC